MASGVTVSDCVITIFNAIKLHKSLEDKSKRIKAVLFCLSADKKTIIPEEGKEILVGDVSETADPYKCFVEMRPPDDCRYALYDCCYETKESKKVELIFIFCAPDCAPLKSKMIYASSKDAIKKKFTGIKHEYQVNCLAEIKDRSCLAERLGGSNICVISVEGLPLSRPHCLLSQCLCHFIKGLPCNHNPQQCLLFPVPESLLEEEKRSFYRQPSRSHLPAYMNPVYCFLKVI